MTEATEILEGASSVLVIDWPSRDVPDTLVRAGFDVTVKGGPGPDNYKARELAGDEIAERPTELPAKRDLIYAHRPVQEMPAIAMLARSIGAKAVWYQSGRTEGGATDPTGCWLPEDESLQARRAAEAAGLAYIDDVYIADAVRQSGIQK